MAPWKAGARRLETASWNLPNSRVIFVLVGVSTVVPSGSYSICCQSNGIK